MPWANEESIGLVPDMPRNFYGCVEGAAPWKPDVCEAILASVVFAEFIRLEFCGSLLL